MSRPRTRDVMAAIEAQTRQRSISELAASGKSHVRVLGTKDVVKLVHAIVDQALAKGGVSLTRDSRDKLAARAQQRLQEFARQRSAADEKIRCQAETIVAFQCTLDSLRSTEADLRRQLDDARVREDRLGEIRVLLSELGSNGSGGGSVDTSELQASFSASLHQALDHIDKAVRRGTGTPVESRPVNATVPMLAKLFEEAPGLESNAAQLDLEDSETEGIAGSLDRLRAMRQRDVHDERRTDDD